MNETRIQEHDETILDFVIPEKDATKTLIEGQHGSLGKGLCELAMNAVDGGAGICRIFIDNDTFTVIDDGAGFGKDPEIALKKFQQLGSRNSEREGSTFGRFGLGRTQVIPWGTITWKSDYSQFKTDYQNHSSFVRSELQERVKGCKVTGKLYRPLSPLELRDVRRELVENLEFTEGITIEVNGSVINDHSEFEWDEETDLYKIRWLEKKGSLYSTADIFCRIYNQGVLVSSLPSTHYPMGAIVVAKKALKVNIARNAPDPQGPVFVAIMNRLDAKAREINREKNKGGQMTLSLRNTLVSLLDAGVEDFPEAIDDETPISSSELGRAKLLRDCRGNFIHIEQLETKPLTIVPGDQIRVGENLTMLNIAVAVTFEEMRYWGSFNAQQLQDRLRQIRDSCCRVAYGNRYTRSPEFLPPVPFEKASLLADTSRRIVPNKELTVTESAARNALQAAADSMAKRISGVEGVATGRRRIVVGECLTAAGWTDSASFIAIERGQLPLANQGISGACALTMLLLHEYTHNNEFPDCDMHGQAFYERYHELTAATGKKEIIGHVSTTLRNRYITELLKKNQLLPEGLKSIATEAEQDHYVLDCAAKQLSEFARSLLDISQLIVRYGQSKVDLVENYGVQDKATKKLVRFANIDLPKKLGLEGLESRFEQKGLTFGRLPVFSQREEFSRNRREVSTAYAEEIASYSRDKLGWSYSAVLALLMAINQGRSGGLYKMGPARLIAQVICIDEHSKCRSFEATSRPLLPYKIIGTGDFTASLNLSEYRGLGHCHDIFDGKALKQDPRSRREWLRIRVEELLSSFANDEERDKAKAYIRDFVLAD